LQAMHLQFRHRGDNGIGAGFGERSDFPGLLG
jgi:hypothetical protein